MSSREVAVDEELIVEIHVPLPPLVDLRDEEDPYPWIDEVLGYLDDIAERGEVSIVDDGEEFEGAYVFSVADSSEDALLAVATRVAAIPGVPTGIFAMVTSDLADGYGAGRRVELG